MITRRIFLKNSGLALVGMGAVPSFVFRTVLAAPGDDRRKKVLITVFQRGGMDGLNTVVPFGERDTTQVVRPSPFQRPAPSGNLRST